MSEIVPDEPQSFVPRRFYFRPNIDATDDEMEADIENWLDLIARAETDANP